MAVAPARTQGRHIGHGPDHGASLLAPHLEVSQPDARRDRKQPTGSRALEAAASGFNVAGLDRHDGTLRGGKLAIGRPEHLQPVEPADQATFRCELRPPGRRHLDDRDIGRARPAGLEQPGDQGLTHLAPAHYQQFSHDGQR